MVEYWVGVEEAIDGDDEAERAIDEEIKEVERTMNDNCFSSCYGQMILWS